MVSLLVEECLFQAFLNTISSLNCCLETELKLLKSMRNSKLNKQFPRKMRIPVRFLFYFFELAAPQCFRRCSRSCIHSFLERFKFCSKIQMIFFFEVFYIVKAFDCCTHGEISLSFIQFIAFTYPEEKKMIVGIEQIKRNIWTVYCNYKKCETSLKKSNSFYTRLVKTTSRLKTSNFYVRCII